MKKKNDNIIYMNGPEEVAKGNKINESKRKAKRKMSVVIILILLVVLCVVVFYMGNRQYKGYKVLKSTDTNYENTANYIQFSENLLKYTPDGVSYINTNGDTVWTAGIDMKKPVAVSSGNYAAVADLNGNKVCVFNEEGQVSSLTMPYTICDVDVANQGAFAVVLESEETNYINLYNKKGEIIYEIQTTIDKSGYPLDITISDDGQKLFTSYLNIGTNQVTNNLTAYNFGDVGQNTNADRMVGGYMVEDEMVTKLEFVDNNNVVAFGTKSITVYSMKEKPSEKATIELDKEIRSVFYNKDYVGVIQEDEGKEGTSYILKVYDLKGNLEFKDKITFNYSNIYAADKEVIISGENNLLIYRTNGSVKFSGQLTSNINSVVPNGNKTEYIIVYDDCTDIIKLKAEPSEKTTAVGGE